MIEYFDHQKVAIEELLPDNDRFCLFWEQGTAKTIPMLVHLSNLFKLGEIETALWVGPVSAYDVVEKNISMLPQHRQNVLREKLVVVNYDKLSRRTSKVAEAIAKQQWDCIVLDEMHKIARPTSNRTKFIIGSGNSGGLASGAKYRYGLTGTPLNQSRYQDLWSYMRFLYDTDYMSYPDFKKRYLKMRNYPPGTYNYIVSGYTRNIEELKSEMAQHAQYLSSSECQDLPEIMPDEIVKVPWKPGKNKTVGNQTTESIYYEALESYIDSLDMVMDNPLARMTKLRQIASGGVKDDEGQSHSLNSYKGEYILDLIEGASSKVVVFFEYRQTRDLILKELDKANVTYLVLDGQQKDKKIWRRFQSDEKVQVFLTQYQSGSESIDLWSAHTTIFAEPCQSALAMEQARKRTHRQGQTHSCNYYFLLTEGTIEEEIYARLLTHNDFNEKFYRDLARLSLERRKSRLKDNVQKRG